MPMAKVFIGFFRSRADTAQTSDESSPPLSRNPTGASASSRFSIPAISLFFMLRHTVSMPS